ncbi:MAG: MmgE/PrpD family protein [Proteobacteria bacterium]|nr:MmgE/PrpD family protein [Pseudomonadota bacterium]
MREQVALHIADALAIGWAATACRPLSSQLLNAMHAGARGGVCQVFGSAHRLPAVQAAFANAALIHTLDFDDIHDTARLHPTAVTLPAAAAAAQVVNAPMRTVMEAVALGNELMCRLGVMYSPQGQGPGSDWFLTQLFGYFGAALSAGVVMGLDEEALVSALGFAYMQAAGGKEAGFGVGATGRSIYPAFAAMGGVTAVQLAQAGLLGPASALDGAANLFRIYLEGDLGPSQLGQLLDPEGWTFAATQIKPWPSCRLSHPYVAAAMALRKQLNGEPLARLNVAVNASAAKLCRPLAQRRRPITLQDAKYSIPYMTAFTLLHGAVNLDNLRQDTLDDARVHAIADRLEISETLPDKPGHPPAQLHAVTTSGRDIWVQAPPFDLDSVGIHTKFADCLAHAGLGAKAEHAWKAMQTLESAPSVDILFNSALWGRA